MDNYTLWTKHGEPGVTMHDGEGDEDNDNNIADWAHLYEAGAFEDEPMNEAEKNSVEDQAPDELGQVLVDAQRDSEILKESKKFEMILEDHKKLLYQIASRGLKSWVLHWKCCNGRQPIMFETEAMNQPMWLLRM
jgi:hypothetical protein